MQQLVRILKATLTANVADPSSNGFTQGSKEAIPCGMIKEIRIRHNTTNKTGNFEKSAYIELWNDPEDSSETPTLVQIGSWGGSLNIQAPTVWIDVSGDTDGAQVMFLGWESRNSSGTDLSTADVETRWEFKTYQGYRVVVIPFRQFIANTTSQVFYPMTEWLSAQEAEKAGYEFQSNMAIGREQYGP